MRYMMMLYRSEDPEVLAQEGTSEAFAEYMAFHTEMAENGSIQFAERVHNSDTATTVRVRDGKTGTTDGPFIETKEQMAGIYIFEAEDLDKAIEIAAKIPTSRIGAVEIRPIFEAPQEMLDGTGE